MVEDKGFCSWTETENIKILTGGICSRIFLGKVAFFVQVGEQ